MKNLKIVLGYFLDESFAPDSWTTTTIHWLADSNYKIRFEDDTAISERVIFPVSANESKGIEDARFVEFTHDNGIQHTMPLILLIMADGFCLN